MVSRKKFIDTVSDEDFIKIVENSHHIYQVGDKLGYTSNSTYGKIGKEIRQRMASLNVKLNTVKTVNLDSYEADCYHTSIRRKVIRDKTIKYACAICGNTGSWLNKPLVLQLDHINGNASDNRLKNLRFLCPNCHTQTPTFGNKNKMIRTKADRHSHYNKECKQCGKSFISNGIRQMYCSTKCAADSRRKIDKLDTKLLMSQIKKHGFRGTGKLYGVSDNAIKHWCEKLGLPSKMSEYK